MNFLSGETFFVLDMETTGNRMKNGDEIIQVGICIIEEGQIIETYSTYVKPNSAIPPFIEQLTGITNQDVQDAPSIAEIVPDILKRLEGRVLVAHNAHFDVGVLQFILNEHGYSPYTGNVIDTVELARILLPNHSGYKLVQLADDFNLQHDHPHRADSDAYATAELFQTLCEKIWHLPVVTLQRMIPISRSLYSDIEVLLRMAEQTKRLQPHLLVTEGEDIDIYRHLALRQDSVNNHDLKLDSREDQAPALSLEEVNKTLTMMIPDYEKRAGQSDLALTVYDSFKQEKHGLFEAATGTGKTLAYLIAAVYWASRYNEKVVISTHTIQLQEQIQEKDLPKLISLLPDTLQSALLKGRHHYLCLRKYENTLFHSEDRNYDHDLAKLQMLVWLTETTTGDVEELNLPSGGKDLWQKVQSETASCIHYKCPWFERCYYFKAKKKAQDADIIITNHSLLLSDLHVHRIIPQHDYLVMDESHQLESIATEQYGKSLSYTGLQFLIQRLIAIDKTNLIEQLKQALYLVIEENVWGYRLEEIEHLLMELKVILDTVFTAVVSFAERKQKKKSIVEEAMKTIRFIHHQEQGEEWLQLLKATESIAVKMNDIVQAYQRLLIQLNSYEQEFSASERGSLTDWKSTMQQLEEQIYLLNQMILQANPDFVYWIEFEPRGARNLATIKQVPLNVSALLEEHLFSKKKSIVLTSATLQVNQSYHYFIEQLGIPKDRLTLKTFESSFDYEKQSALFISNDISLIQEVNQETYANELAYFILDVVRISQGRTMVLFTSNQMLRQTYSFLKEPLVEEGIALFAQGIDSGSRSKLTKNFQSQEKAILLGTNSFWEGVDIPGKQLSCLIIVKLPFTPPNTPFFEAKSDQLKAEGKNPFMDYALPQAVIRFKQGFGRLIRKSTDKGVVVVFDRRMVEKRYGKYFIKSLPSLTIKSVNREELIQEIQQWLG